MNLFDHGTHGSERRYDFEAKKASYQELDKALCL
jgi:hypothetical protein